MIECTSKLNATAHLPLSVYTWHPVIYDRMSKWHEELGRVCLPDLSITPPATLEFNFKHFPDDVQELAVFNAFGPSEKVPVDNIPEYIHTAFSGPKNKHRIDRTLDLIDNHDALKPIYHQLLQEPLLEKGIRVTTPKSAPDLKDFAWNFAAGQLVAGLYKRIFIDDTQLSDRQLFWSNLIVASLEDEIDWRHLSLRLKAQKR